MAIIAQKSSCIAYPHGVCIYGYHSQTVCLKLYWARKMHIGIVITETRITSKHELIYSDVRLVIFEFIIPAYFHFPTQSVGVPSIMGRKQNLDMQDFCVKRRHST